MAVLSKFIKFTYLYWTIQTLWVDVIYTFGGNQEEPDLFDTIIPDYVDTCVKTIIQGGFEDATFQLGKNSNCSILNGNFYHSDLGHVSIANGNLYDSPETIYNCLQDIEEEEEEEDDYCPTRMQEDDAYELEYIQQFKKYNMGYYLDDPFLFQDMEQLLKFINGEPFATTYKAKYPVQTEITIYRNECTDKDGVIVVRFDHEITPLFKTEIKFWLKLWFNMYDHQEDQMLKIVFVGDSSKKIHFKNSMFVEATTMSDLQGMINSFLEKQSLKGSFSHSNFTMLFEMFIVGYMMELFKKLVHDENEVLNDVATDPKIVDRLKAIMEGVLENFQRRHSNLLYLKSKEERKQANNNNVLYKGLLFYAKDETKDYPNYFVMNAILLFQQFYKQGDDDTPVDLYKYSENSKPNETLLHNITNEDFHNQTQNLKLGVEVLAYLLKSNSTIENNKIKQGRNFQVFDRFVNSLFRYFRNDINLSYLLVLYTHDDIQDKDKKLYEDIKKFAKHIFSDDEEQVDDYMNTDSGIFRLIYLNKLHKNGENIKIIEILGSDNDYFNNTKQDLIKPLCQDDDYKKEVDKYTDLKVMYELDFKIQQNEEIQNLQQERTVVIDARNTDPIIMLNKAKIAENSKAVADDVYRKAQYVSRKLLDIIQYPQKKFLNTNENRNNMSHLTHLILGSLIWTFLDLTNIAGRLQDTIMGYLIPGEEPNPTLRAFCGTRNVTNDTRIEPLQVKPLNLKENGYQNLTIINNSGSGMNHELKVDVNNQVLASLKRKDASLHLDLIDNGRNKKIKLEVEQGCEIGSNPFTIIYGNLRKRDNVGLFDYLRSSSLWYDMIKSNVISSLASQIPVYGRLVQFLVPLLLTEGFSCFVTFGKNVVTQGKNKAILTALMTYILHLISGSQMDSTRYPLTQEEYDNL